MPSKGDVKTLIVKMKNSSRSFCELQEEFEVLFSTKPSIEQLKPVFDGIAAKYREIKKLQENIANKLGDIEDTDERLKDVELAGSKVKTEYFKLTQKYAVYMNECNQQAKKSEEPSASTAATEPSALEAMTAAVTKMAEALSSAKQSSSTSLERLPVPSWDGNRRTYTTWKKEFNHAMEKYKQDPDERLQRFRKAMPRNCWWSEQVKTCKSIDQAWEILDVEFQDKRKLMDSLLADINNLKSVKRDSKSLTMFATTIQRYVNDMEDNGCPVNRATESPFFMSQLLSKLDPRDNVDFGREMKREKEEENVKNLLHWLHQEASLRSRGKKDVESDEKAERYQRPVYQRRSDHHATSTTASTKDDESCPYNCTEKHLLPACPVYQSSTVSQRWDTVKKHQRCRKCLRASHHTNDCKKADGTSCDKCKKNHHRTLHNDRKVSSNAVTNADTPSTASEGVTADSNNLQTNATHQEQKVKTSTALCPVQKIKVQNNEGQFVECLAMLDSGSNTSLLSKRLAKQLGLTGPTTHLTMNLAGGKTKSEDSNIIQITLAPMTEEGIEKSLQVYTVIKPCSNAKTISKNTIKEYSHLKPVADKLHLSGGTVDLLIGTDFADAFVDVHTLSGESGEPIAKRNCFGWYALGQFNLTTSEDNSSYIKSVNVNTVSAVDDIKKLLYQDQLGVKPTKLCTCSDDTLKENKFIKSVSSSTTLHDGRVHVKMPWKDSGPPTSSNYDIALKRMYSSEKTFKKRDCFEVVEEEVQKLVDQGFVKRVPQEEVNHDEPEWYLPLQAVFTPEKTTKVRLVFDASSKGHNGLSLNDHLEKGPNYINNLTDVLLTWRWDNVAYSGDIRKMFNQIVVHPDDQVYHRFLWRSGPDKEPTVYQWCRLSFGDKPAPDIATNSINVLAKASQEEFPEAAQELQDHAYVDDIAGSTSEVSQAKQLTKDIDEILAKGHFQIKTWHSNHKEIDKSNEEKTVDILGHRWNKESDKFSFKKDEIVCKQELLTKRHCLALVAQLWDPIGLVAPVTVKFRIDLQELWSSGFGWDDTLPDNVQQRWKENTQTMNNLLQFDFDRQLKPTNAVGEPEVHGFSDAGELAYGAVIFLRWLLSDGTYRCVPIMVKSFVAPLKKKSIPRLELLGCITLIRMYDACAKALVFVELRNCKKVFWVDSSTVLSWVRTAPREFKPFVSARIAEIQETVDTSDFKYIRSKSNPADALTRGIDAEQLKEWLNGPSFLQLPEADWPEFKDTKTTQSIESEMKTKKRARSDVECVTSTMDSQPVKPITVEGNADNPILTNLLKNCSTFPKMRRTLAYVYRFISKARRDTKASGPITVEELRKSEQQLIKWCQSHLNVTKLPELKLKLDDNGLVRAHGRLEAITSVPKDMRNPIVLPAKHKLVDLILQDIHDRRGHCGYKSLIHESRRKFWIIGVRTKAKSLSRDCIICRKLRRKPLEQLMGQIPSLRVAVGQPAFTNTAMDMFGPLYIRLNRKTLKEAQVIIFTCMTTRAIHLELVTDKSSDTFLMAFRRLVSTRGHPKVCYSDCGTNFVGAQHYLKEVTRNWDINEIKNTLAEKHSCDFRWEWNVPHASHQNGVVESLIKSVRQALNATCKNQTYSEEQWRTILAEITYLVNGRPLYPSSDDIWERPPITPNDILIGVHSHSPQPEAEDRVNPRDLVRSTQHKVDEFWRCWIKYFAPNLLPRNKWYRTIENVQVGDLVLELDPNHKRSQWKMALIVSTYPGKDGLVRKVRIKTSTGEYDRPIHKLCLIATHQELNSNKS